LINGDPTRALNGPDVFVLIAW